MYRTLSHALKGIRNKQGAEMLSLLARGNSKRGIIRISQMNFAGFERMQGEGRMDRVKYFLKLVLSCW